MHILFLSRWYPWPQDNGSKIRVYNLLRGLAQRHQVSLVSFYDPARGEPEQEPLRSICQTIHVAPWKPFQPDSRASRLGFFSSTPRAYLDMYSKELEQCIYGMIQTQDIDLVIASQTDMATYFNAFEQKPSIFEEVEVGVWRDHIDDARSIGSRLRSALTWMKHRKYLARLMGNFLFCTVVSEKERQILLREISGNMTVEVVPNCVDLQVYEDIVEIPLPNSLIFSGSLTYRPNYQAVCWFLEEVFPLVRARVNTAQLVITGDHAGLPLPSIEGVTLTGLLPDVRPWIAGAACSVVPLLTGGGTRLKILEAMALRTPVVATSKGTEGLDIETGRHILVADKPQEFANCIVRLMEQPALRQQVADDAFRLVQARYNWGIVMERYLGLVDQVVPGGASKGTLNQATEKFQAHRR